MTDDRQGQEEFNRLVVEKIKADPDFLGHLLEAPEVALEQAGLADAARALVEQVGPLEDDVAGHRVGRLTYYWTCAWKSYPYKYHVR